jgi:hypothetical protein
MMLWLCLAAIPLVLFLRKGESRKPEPIALE